VKNVLKLFGMDSKVLIAWCVVNEEEWLMKYNILKPEDRDTEKRRAVMATKNVHDIGGATLRMDGTGCSGRITCLRYPTIRLYFSKTSG
jgi:hypothetical protein